MSGNNLIAGALLLNALGLWACAGAIVYSSGHATVLVSTPQRAPFVIDGTVGISGHVDLGTVDLGKVDVDLGGSLLLDTSTSGLDVNVKGQ